MKLHEMMQFKAKIERKRNYFNLNNLPDDEWARMLSRAKVESTIVKKENTLFDYMYSMMCSRKLSFVLSMAIIAALILSFLYANPSVIKNSELDNINTASTNRRNIPVINVSRL
ncbi:hypothetical protein [Brachyspira pilosicoli]|uniref:hypothetical protein n=1 Tax=Brachyspira pilosicoli TaxID=52584 RepID=UPI001CA48E67|nr:hypothetical protein [Brachyspira pilosicoli]MBW5398166.1 hypothetical protein [Brachyspira pilosicoli]